MARRKTNVTKEVRINNRDRIAFEILSKGGWVSKDVIVEKTSNNRLEVWRDKGVWEVKTFPDNNGNSFTSVRLTRKGEELAEKTWGLSDHARTKVSSIGHDTAVGNKLSSLTETERETAMTEDAQWKVFHQKVNELRQEVTDLKEKSENFRYVSSEDREQAREQWLEKLDRVNQIDDMFDRKEFSATDLAYINEQGELICYEVITSNYSREERAQKQAFASIIGARLIEERV